MWQACVGSIQTPKFDVRCTHCHELDLVGSAIFFSFLTLGNPQMMKIWWRRSCPSTSPPQEAPAWHLYADHVIAPEQQADTRFQDLRFEGFGRVFSRLTKTAYRHFQNGGNPHIEATWIYEKSI